MSQPFRGFSYFDGTPVHCGDHVFTGNRLHGVPVEGIVVLVIEPGSPDCTNYACPDGGVLVREDWAGTESLMLLTPPDGASWEDLELIRRGRAD